MRQPLIIVGASYAGVALAAAARANGFEENIILLGEEAHPPYQRPPLSKGYLLGTVDTSQLVLRSDAYYAENRISLQPGVRATGVDASARTVSLDDGRTLSYGWLALTTGARCRPLVLPDVTSEAAHEDALLLRTLDDARRLLETAKTPRRICIVGGGFIGLEIASVLVQGGHEVCVVEAAPRLLTRALPAEVSAFVESVHRQRGVQFIFDARITGVERRNGQVRALLIGATTRLECDSLIAGIGVTPRDELARSAGIETNNGILVDRHARASAPGVVAAGDCASFMHPFAPPNSGPHRPESIQAANDMARAAAATVVGRLEPYSSVPWFWSDQYDLKLQMTGIAAPGDRLVVRGRHEEGRFTVFAHRDGLVTAAYSVNRPAEHFIARKLVASAEPVDADALADASTDLKTLIPPRAVASDVAPAGSN